MFGWFKQRKKYSLEHLNQLYLQLLKNPVVTEANKNLIIEVLREIAELMIWGDQHNPQFFDFFLEKNILQFFLTFLDQKVSKSITIQLLQTLSIFIENIRNEVCIYYLFSNDHINGLIVHKFDFSDDELLAYYVSFLKSISLKLNRSTIQFFFNELKHDFPLYTEAVKFFRHEESMIRIAVRTLTLNVYRVEDEAMRRFILDENSVPYFNNLVWFIRSQAAGIEELMSKTTFHGKAALDNIAMELMDTLYYLSDIFDLNIVDLNHRLTDRLLEYFVVPCLVSSLEASSGWTASRSQTGAAQLQSPEHVISPLLALFLLCEMFRAFSTPILVGEIAQMLLDSSKVDFLTYREPSIEENDRMLSNCLRSFKDRKRIYSVSIKKKIVEASPQKSAAEERPQKLVVRPHQLSADGMAVASQSVMSGLAVGECVSPAVEGTLDRSNAPSRAFVDTDGSRRNAGASDGEVEPPSHEVRDIRDGRSLRSVASIVFDVAGSTTGVVVESDSEAGRRSDTFNESSLGSSSSVVPKSTVDAALRPAMEELSVPPTAPSDCSGPVAAPREVGTESPPAAENGAVRINAVCGEPGGGTPCKSELFECEEPQTCATGAGVEEAEEEGSRDAAPSEGSPCAAKVVCVEGDPRLDSSKQVLGTPSRAAQFSESTAAFSTGDSPTSNPVVPAFLSLLGSADDRVVFMGLGVLLAMLRSKVLDKAQLFGGHAQAPRLRRAVVTSGVAGSKSLARRAVSPLAPQADGETLSGTDVDSVTIASNAERENGSPRCVSLSRASSASSSGLFRMDIDPEEFPVGQCFDYPKHLIDAVLCAIRRHPAPMLVSEKLAHEVLVELVDDSLLLACHVRELLMAHRRSRSGLLHRLKRLPSRQMFVELFEDEAAKMKPLHFSDAVANTCILLPQTDTALSGLTPEWRAPVGPNEECVRDIQRFLLIHTLIQYLECSHNPIANRVLEEGGGSPETILLLPALPDLNVLSSGITNSFLPIPSSRPRRVRPKISPLMVEKRVFQEHDLLNLSGMETFACTVIAVNGRHMRRFLVCDLENAAVIVVRSDPARPAWATVRFAAPLKDINIWVDEQDARLLHLSYVASFTAQQLNERLERQRRRRMQKERPSKDGRSATSEPASTPQVAAAEPGVPTQASPHAGEPFSQSSAGQRVTQKELSIRLLFPNRVGCLAAKETVLRARSLSMDHKLEIVLQLLDFSEYGVDLEDEPFDVLHEPDPSSLFPEHSPEHSPRHVAAATVEWDGPSKPPPLPSHIVAAPPSGAVVSPGHAGVAIASTLSERSQNVAMSPPPKPSPPPVPLAVALGPDRSTTIALEKPKLPPPLPPGRRSSPQSPTSRNGADSSFAGVPKTFTSSLIQSIQDRAETAPRSYVLEKDA